MIHPTGKHGFAIFNDDARTRECMEVTLTFLSEYLEHERVNSGCTRQHKGAFESDRLGKLACLTGPHWSLYNK